MDIVVSRIKCIVRNTIRSLFIIRERIAGKWQMDKQKQNNLHNRIEEERLHNKRRASRMQRICYVMVKEFHLIMSESMVSDYVLNISESPHSCRVAQSELPYSDFKI
jgi:hypothetical protein